MNRLNAELLRLYGPLPDSQAAPHAPVRSFALASHQPATSWTTLAPLWHAVQSTLGLPAPGIAVDGQAGFLLCFSLTEAVPPEDALAFLDGLVRQHGTADGAALQRLLTWDPTPRPVQADQWSAFVARDLAPVFDDTPWLDIEPSADGQAELLSALRSIPLVDFQAALARCCPPETTAPASLTAALPDQPLSPREFLQRVMNDASAPLALRVDAAKALLAAPRPGHPNGD